MLTPYGYGELEDRLIALFLSGPPDFAAAQALVDAGADLNARGADPEENMLSLILDPYWWEGPEEVCGGCEHRGGCASGWHCRGKNPGPGWAMLQIIRFFLDNGFDVTARGGQQGAECLQALTRSAFDRSVLTATRMLLDAGARDLGVPPGTGETALEEAAFERGEATDPYHRELFGALCELYLAEQQGD